MDSIISTALSEICSQGPSGLPLSDLWPRLRNFLSSSGLHLHETVKTAIWNNLRSVPGLQFKAQSSNFDSWDPLIQSYKDSENLKVKVVAGEELRDCYVGVYDLKFVETGIPLIQRRVLDAVAVTRTKGITQSQLAKEFDKKGNSIFYIVKNLECQGLIVRQSTIVKTKEITSEAEDGLKNTSMNTNLIHLYRHSKHLSFQQRLEITKEDTLESLMNAVDNFTKDDVLVKDYLPELKAICNKLEQADNQVLAVTDIKRALGYQKRQGHRAWRHILKKLKDAGTVVEELDEVNKKVRPHLHLLKKFDSKNFLPKSVGCRYDDLDIEEPVQFRNRGQITEQLLEIPIEQQIYDMINAEGFKGITVMEVCGRLGIHNKRNNARFEKLFAKLGMPVRGDSHNKSTVKRVWTSKNFNHSSTVTGTFKDILHKDEFLMPRGMDIVISKESDQTILDNSEANNQENFEDVQIGVERRDRFAEDGESYQMLICGSTSQDSLHKNDSENCTESSTALVEAPKPPSSNPSKRRSFPGYPSSPVTIPSAQRERRILELLQEEKFKLKVELYRSLENFAKDKPITMDRKTLVRSLNNLQEEGLCKCIQVTVPIVTNCCKNRTIEVVFNKSFQGLTEEIVEEIQERWRFFEKQNRGGQCLAQPKNEDPFPVPTNKERTPKPQYSDAQAVRVDAMLANGYVTGKMVRAKLLHKFLWGYVSSSSEWDAALNNPHSTYKMFAMDVVRKAMPLELFLQVVGSTKKFEDLVESCKRGLCLSDLPVLEYRSLMDTLAAGSLARIIDILQRLKLIRLVTGGHVEDADITLTHALELKPYIEEPELSFTLGNSCLDRRPTRYDFILSNRREVDKYWKTLEGCYATADPTAAKHAFPGTFPGSSVKEVFNVGSWSSVRVMTAEQRAELLKRVAKDDQNIDHVRIAKDLNLTVAQTVKRQLSKLAKKISWTVDYDVTWKVLRASNDKRHRLQRIKKDLNPKEQESKPQTSKSLAAFCSRNKSETVQPKKRMKKNDARGMAEKQSIPMEPDHEHQYIGEINCSLPFSEPQLCDEENARVSGSSEEDVEENYDFISQCAFSKMKQARLSKFSWTETSDRQLVIQYVRQRAILGPRLNRIDWVSLVDLPAPPNTSKRRMASLKRDLNVRRAIMRLCNLLGERRKHFNRSHGKEPLDHNSLSEEGLEKIFSPCPVNSLEYDFEVQQWDDFNDKNVKLALNEVLRWKRIAKREASRKAGPIIEKVTQEEAELISHGEEIMNNNGKREHRSRSYRLPEKFLKLLNEDVSVSRRAYESLAVANSVELLKLVFLSTPMSSDAPNLAIETLRHYSEHDIFTAFNFLREKKIMVGGSGSQPFVLSQQFLHSVSSSKFPTNTRERAVKFKCWLNEREKDLMEEGIHLNADLQCGDIFHLFALVSSGELSISPCLPDEGIGEAENKTKVDRDGESISRREKGFPGIKVSISRANISRAAAMESWKDDRFPGSQPILSINSSHNFCKIIPVEDSSDKSPWKSMSIYSEHLLSTSSSKELTNSLHPELFETVCSTLHKAGDQGLSMVEIYEITGESIAELVVDILQVFGLAIKVR
ncbi:hypothetical protein GIB67_009778 [Kingdonia uniflora]|uniref:B-block binding subunit of TFIIIC domain-containing protein n=1 Tax=Kingdonia uniflora TaxID=39325 RepID=A0A7J7LXG2_9MAGN|nr:hypothetical protein GIB67_009778 [Kingdonia uniflora]